MSGGAAAAAAAAAGKRMNDVREKKKDRIDAQTDSFFSKRVTGKYGTVCLSCVREGRRRNVCYSNRKLLEHQHAASADNVYLGWKCVLAGQKVSNSIPNVRGESVE